MYVVIIGAGMIGSHLARLLIKEECDVVVVDKNGDVCQELSQELEIVTIRGDATKPKTLENAGVKNADAVVVLTGSDETNLIVSLIAKQVGAEYVVTRLGALHYDETVLKNLGIDLVVYPEAAAAGYISQIITKPEVLDLTFLSRGDAEIIELKVKPESRIAGKKLSEIQQPKGARIIAVVKDGRLSIPENDTVIEPESKILVLSKVDSVREARKLAD